MTTNSVLVQNPNPVDHVLLGVEEREEPEEPEEPENKLKNDTLYLLGTDILIDIVEFTFLGSPIYLIMILFTLWGILGVQNEKQYIIKIYLIYTTCLISAKIYLFYKTLYIIVLLGTLFDFTCLVMVFKTYNKLV